MANRIVAQANCHRETGVEEICPITMAWVCIAGNLQTRKEGRKLKLTQFGTAMAHLPATVVIICFVALMEWTTANGVVIAHHHYMVSRRYVPHGEVCQARKTLERRAGLRSLTDE